MTTPHSILTTGAKPGVPTQQTRDDRVVTAIVTALTDQDHTYAWLARQTGIRYKRLLAELKHRRRPLSLETTVHAGEALGIEVPGLLALAA